MLDHAYNLGAQQALEDFEKEAGLGSALWSGAKFLTGFGGRTSQWVGMPLGGGLLGAAMADPGERMKGFAGGVVGGAMGNVGMHLGGKMFKGLAGNIGKRIGATETGAKMWGGLGKINPGYGAAQLAKHEGAMADAALKGAKAPAEFTGNAAHSFGQHVASKWLPGAAGLAGGLAGYSYFSEPGAALGSSLVGKDPNFGSFSRRSAFNPVQF